jgi:hypothetical protein
MEDVFQAFLIREAQLSENFEFPILHPCHEIPKNLVPFSKTKDADNYNQFVHFYEIDNKILAFGKNPQIYFPRLSQFKGAIGCDISVCRNMPFALQIFHTYWNRALTFWLQNQNFTVVPNVRFGDERSYSFCFEGIPPKSVISIGTHGCMKKKEDIHYETKGVSETIKQLKPEAIILYGTVNEKIKYLLETENVPYEIFPSNTSGFFKNRENESCPFLDGLDMGDV